MSWSHLSTKPDLSYDHIISPMLLVVGTTFQKSEGTTFQNSKRKFISKFWRNFISKFPKFRRYYISKFCRKYISKIHLHWLCCKCGVQLEGRDADCNTELLLLHLILVTFLQRGAEFCMPPSLIHLRGTCNLVGTDSPTFSQISSPTKRQHFWSPKQKMT